MCPSCHSVCPRCLLYGLAVASAVNGLAKCAESCTVRVVAKTVPFTEARTRLSELFDEVEQRHEHVIITRNGHPAAVMVSADEYEALEETLEVLNDEETLAALRESEEDVQAGRVFTLDTVRRELGLG